MVHLRAAVAVIVALVAVALAPAVAIAETDRGRDARHDVTRYAEESDGPAPHHANGDIVRHRITYGERRITAVIQFATLRRGTRLLWVGTPLQWRQGSDRRNADLGVKVTRRTSPQGTATLDGDGDDACPVRSRIRYVADVVRLSMPAGCIGTPPAIRAYAGAYTYGDMWIYFDLSPDLSRREGVRIEQGAV